MKNPPQDRRGMKNPSQDRRGMKHPPQGKHGMKNPPQDRRGTQEWHELRHCTSILPPIRLLLAPETYIMPLLLPIFS